MPYPTEQEARDSYAGEGAPQAKLTAVMEAAAGTVRRIAPPPGAADATYDVLAKSSELLAGEYLWLTGGFRQRESQLDASANYGTMADVEQSIRDIMGDYATYEQVTEGSFSLEIPSTLASYEDSTA